MANDLSENTERQGTETFVFDNSAKKFLSNRLIKEIFYLAKTFEEAEYFMVDPSVTDHDIADFLSKEGKTEKIRDVLDRFEPVVQTQISTLMKELPYRDLSIDSLIEKFKNKLKDSFKGVNFAGRPLLKMIVEELMFLIVLAVINGKPNDLVTNDPRAKNIEASKEFAGVMADKFKMTAMQRLSYGIYATRLHKSFKGHALHHTNGEVILHLREDANLEFINSISIEKKEDAKPFEFATVKIVYKDGEEEKSFLTTISLLNSQLNGWGSSVVHMRDIFTAKKADAHYEYIRFKIFEAIEDALIEERLKTKETLEKEKKLAEAKVPAVSQAVAVEVQKVVDKPATILEDDATTEEVKPKKKKIEGTKQFANLKLDAAAKALLRFEGVEEIDSWQHSGCRTFTRMVDDKRETANLMPFGSNKYEVNPKAVKNALDIFKIDYEDFKALV